MRFKFHDLSCWAVGTILKIMSLKQLDVVRSCDELCNSSKKLLLLDLLVVVVNLFLKRVRGVNEMFCDSRIIHILMY